MNFQCPLYSASVLIFLINQGLSQPCFGDLNKPCPQCPKGLGPYPACDQCVDSRLDLSSCCTQCKQGEEHCSSGNFDLTVIFHSYANLKHLCGECRHERFGPTCCDNIFQSDKNNCPTRCGLRMIVSVEAFQSPALHVAPSETLAKHRIYLDNIVNFPHAQEIFPGVSNPYVTSTTTWTERFQLYIVTVDYHNNDVGVPDVSAVDRFQINVDLGAPPAQAERQRYSGIYNISYFDISFDIKCSENYYGQDCNTFCLPVRDLFTCNEMGRKACVNQSCDPSSYCLMCSSSTLKTTASSSPHMLFLPTSLLAWSSSPTSSQRWSLSRSPLIMSSSKLPQKSLPTSLQVWSMLRPTNMCLLSTSQQMWSAPTSQQTRTSSTSLQAKPLSTSLQTKPLSASLQARSSSTSLITRIISSSLQTLPTPSLNSGRDFHIDNSAVLIGVLISGILAIFVFVGTIFCVLGMMLFMMQRVANNEAINFKRHEDNVRVNPGRRTMDMDNDMTQNEAYGMTTHDSPIYEAIV